MGIAGRADRFYERQFCLFVPFTPQFTVLSHRRAANLLKLPDTVHRHPGRMSQLRLIARRPWLFVIVAYLKSVRTLGDIF